MTTAPAQPTERRLRIVAILAAAALSVAIVAGAWQLGAQLRPAEMDVDAARQAAYEAAYHDASVEVLEPAYTQAWPPAYEQGAAAGRRDGAAAGVAAARAGA